MTKTNLLFKSTLIILLLSSSLFAQPGFFREDNSTIFSWGNVAINNIVDHYITAAGEPTISTPALSFTGHIRMANDKYVFAKDTLGSNIGVLGMNGDNNIVFGTTSIPGTPADGKGDILFYRRGTFIMKITGTTFEPATASSIFLGKDVAPFAGIHTNALYARGNTVTTGGEVVVYNATNTGSVTITASSDLTSPAAYKILLPKLAPTAVNQTLVYTGSSFPGEYSFGWGTGGGSYPLSHLGTGTVDHLLSTNGPNVTLAMTAYSSSAVDDRGGITLRRARGTQGSEIAVAGGDRLGTVGGLGWAAGTFATAARIDFRADSVAGANISGGIDFVTSNSSGTITSKWRVDGGGALYPTVDNTSNFSSAANRPNSSYFRTVDVANDSAIYTRDTGNTAIAILKMNGSNWIEFGTKSATTDPTKGDIEFYRNGTSRLKLDSNGFTPTTAFVEQLGTTSKQYASLHTANLTAYSNPGTGVRGVIAIASGAGGTFVNLKNGSADGANYDLILPSTAPTASGQTLVTQSGTGFPLAWASGGVTYPLNNTGTAGGGDVAHLLSTDSQNVTLSLTAYSSTAQTDRGGITLRRARGSSSSPSNVVAGDREGIIATQAYVGGALRTTSTIIFTADSVDTVNNRIPTRIDFGTMNAAGTVATRWTLQSEGHWVPGSHYTSDIGSSGTRPRTAYLTDLNLAGTVSSNLVPDLGLTRELGNGGARWATLYVHNINMTGSCTGCPGGGSVDWANVPASILPSISGIYDLGSGTRLWNGVYASSYLGSSIGIANSFSAQAGQVTIGGILGGTAQLYFTSGSTVRPPSGATVADGTYCAATGLHHFTISQGFVTNVFCN